MNMFGWIGCALLSIFAVAAGEGWTEDFTAAQKKAAERNLPVLAVFTGSDWCGPCQALKSKVFDTPEFAEYAKSRFVPVVLDFPKGKAQDETVKKQNADLSAYYRVTGFPTALVLTPSGDVLGGFIGGFDKFEEVKNPLDAAHAVLAPYENARKRAEAAQGEEKLAALIEAYKTVPRHFQKYHQLLAEEIIALDKNDRSGLWAERLREEKLAEERQACDEALRPAAQQGPEVFLATLDALLQKDFAGETKFNLLGMKFHTLLSTATDEQTFAGALNIMDTMIAANPGEKEQIQRFRKHLEERRTPILEANRKRVEALKTASKEAVREPGKP